MRTWRIAAVTWDAAGTLLRVRGSVGRHYADVASRFGVAADADRLDAAFPGAFRQAVAEWRVPYGADEADARAFWDRVIALTFAAPLAPAACAALFDHFAAAEAWEPLPGAAEALALIAASGRTQAVVSNFDGRLAGLLAAHRLGPFAAVVTSAAVGRAKPDPAPLLHAARALRVVPARILHLGDSAREDGACAAAVGAAWLPVEGGVDLAALRRRLEDGDG